MSNIFNPVADFFITILLTATAISSSLDIRTRKVRTITGCEHIIVPGSIVLQRFRGGVIYCTSQCLLDDRCLSIQVNTSDTTCTLNNFTAAFGCTNLTTDPLIKHYGKPQPCLNGGYLNASGRCKCVDGWIGTRCERLMAHCKEGQPYGYNTGVYQLHPEGASEPVTVYCFANLIAVNQHFTTTFNFNRSWSEYKNGFGSPPGNLWLGLDNLHLFTSRYKHRLVTYISIKNTTRLRSQVLEFTVSNESSNYVMNYDRAIVSTVDKLGDSLVDMKGQPFSTYDQDNDNDTTRNCAAEQGGGYWYNACGRCNPTGPLIRPLSGNRLNVPNEIFWTDDLGDVAPYMISQALFYEGSW